MKSNERQKSVEVYGNQSLTASDIQAQINLMQDVMKRTMIEGTHFGTIPGTKTKSLYKPGAEKLMATFRLSCDPFIEDLSRDDEIQYRIKINVRSFSGQFLGAGIGECSSKEDKYAWRAAVCKEEFDITPENRRRIKFSKYNGKVEQKQQVRTNPRDLANTILKMAKKRALVDSILTVTAASDIFTQDIEDLPDELVDEISNRKDKPPKKSNQSTSTKPEDYKLSHHGEPEEFATKDQINLIEKLCSELQKEEGYIKKAIKIKFGHEDLSKVPKKFAEDWINNLQKKLDDHKKFIEEMNSADETKELTNE